MRNEELLELIDELNKNKYKNIIKIRISDEVDVIKIYFNDSFCNKNSAVNYSQTYFLLKDQAQKNNYIGIVLDMEDNFDLHAMLQEKYRGNQYMSQALKTTIIPYVFLDRDRLELSFKDEKVYRHFINTFKLEKNKIIKNNEGHKIIKLNKNDYYDKFSHEFKKQRLEKSDYEQIVQHTETIKRVNHDEIKEDIINFIAKKIFMCYEKLHYISKEEKENMEYIIWEFLEFEFIHNHKNKINYEDFITELDELFSM